MRIDRRAHRAPSGLDVAQERQQHRQIVALRKALLLHQTLPIEHGVGKQKTVGRDQVDLGPRRPARQQRLEHARGGRFADRDRAGDADDVGHLAVAGCRETGAAPDRAAGWRRHRSTAGATAADRCPRPPCRSSRSCIERSRSNSPGSSVIGVSSRSSAHCSREKTR